MSDTEQQLARARQLLDMDDTATQEEVLTEAQTAINETIQIIAEALVPIWEQLTATVAETFAVLEPYLDNEHADAFRWTPTLDDDNETFENWLTETAEAIRDPDQ